MRFIFLNFILFCLLSNDSFALTLGELGDELATPVTTDAKYVLLGGAVLTLGFVLFEDQIIDPFQEKQVRNKTLGESSVYGDILGQLVPNALYVGGMSIAGLFKDPKGYDRAIGMFKATLYSSTATTILKYTIRQPRPYNKQIKNSFPSGHATTAFAFSGFVAAEHGWAWGIPATLMGMFVGYSRINDNAHYLHDVVAGGTIGWVYGWGIAKYMKNKSENKNQTYFAPILDTKTAGIGFYREL